MTTTQQIFEVAAAIIASVGGSSVIILGLSSWLGKVWANRILENEKAAHDKELQGYRSKLEQELSKMEVFQEKALYISKAQYDNEYSIYREIWETMRECIVKTSMLYPKVGNLPSDEKEKEEYQKKKYDEYIDAFNQFSKTIDKAAPFYKEDFYNSFVTIRKMCSEVGNIFSMYEFKVKYSASFALARDLKMDAEEKKIVYIDFPKKIKEIEESLRKDIREYLLGLQLK